MEIPIASSSVFVYTGGRPFDAGLPVVVLIHGAGHDHSVWNFQARQLAHHGFSVVAPDLPGHGRSGGPSLASVESLAEWVAALLDALGVDRAALVGHSMGSLVALHAATQMPARVSRLILIGSAVPMPVADPLLQAARETPGTAHAMINQWSYTPASQLGASASPGVRLTTMNLRLMERQPEGVLANDLAACNGYQRGLDAAAEVLCPTLLLCGERDQMTPHRAVKPLQEALTKVPGGARVAVIPGAGHAMMAEAPAAVGAAIRRMLDEK
ncbi:alpha/beta fold hydrolase [Aromatoleum sp.]|uniref:alpha/beta fold hydrolase n=1 Tax=Aromatoleum sp. TaxID=2307007 RepID=UPI002FCA1AFE